MERYIPGAHNALCDICGFKFKSNEMRLNWKNQFVCGVDYEQKHPQLTLKPHPDRQAVRNARPRQGTVTLADTPISDTNTSELV